MENKQELSPCPFCGKNEWRMSQAKHYVSVCKSCGCRIEETMRDHRPIEDQLKADLGEMIELYILLTDFVAIDTVLDMFPPEHQDRACKIYDGIATAAALKTKWGI